MNIKILPVNVLVPVLAPNPPNPGLAREDIGPNRPPVVPPRLKLGADVVAPNPTGLAPNRLVPVLVPKKYNKE